MTRHRSSRSLGAPSLRNQRFRKPNRMKTELTYVTPELARKWLESNTCNRPLRPNVVETLKRAYERGEWKLTHQGVAFSNDGVLLDGQHRLTMISQLPEGSIVPIQVTRGLSADTFDVIDQHLKRTLSDVMGVSGDLAAVGRFLARVHNSSTTAGLTATYTQPFVDLAREPFSDLMTFCPTARKFWSSASVRAAAIVRMIQGEDRDYVRVAYRSLVLQDFAAMTPIAQSLCRQQLSGVAVGARTLDLFCRALKVFDSRNASLSKLQLKDTSAQLAAVRQLLDAMVMLQKNAPAHAGAREAKPTLIVARG